MRGLRSCKKSRRMKDPWSTVKEENVVQLYTKEREVGDPMSCTQSSQELYTEDRFNRSKELHTESEQPVALHTEG